MKIVGSLEGGDLMKEVNHGGGIKWGGWVGWALGFVVKFFSLMGRLSTVYPLPWEASITK